MMFRCTWIIGEEGKLKQFSSADQDKMIVNLIEPMANDSLRTICIAYKDFVMSTMSSILSRRVIIQGVFKKLVH